MAKGTKGKAGKSRARTQTKMQAKPMKRAAAPKTMKDESAGGVRGQKPGDLADDEGALGEPLQKSRLTAKKK
jgi:hypothetical protein